MVRGLLTIIRNLVLREFLFVVVKNRSQGVCNTRGHTLTPGVEFGQVVGLLDQCIESSDFKLGDGKRLHSAVFGVHRRT